MEVEALAKMGFGLLVILLLLGGLLACIRYLQDKKGMFPKHSVPIRVQQSVHLGGKHKLSVIQWGQTNYLVGFSQGSGFLIDQMPVDTMPISSKQDDQS